MSKGIIVKDIPNSCMSCECRICFDGESYCGANRSYLDDWEFDLNIERPQWCPIKAIPERKQVDMFHEDRGVFAETPIINIGMQMGWNACIDKIER